MNKLITPFILAITLIIPFVLTTIVIFVTSSSISLAAPLKPVQHIELTRPDEGKIVVVGKDLFTFKHRISENILGDVSIIEVTHPPYQGLPFLLKKHSAKAAENFYVLSGEFEFFDSQSNGTIKAQSGDVIHIPSDIPHSYKHVGAETGKMLIITTPAWFQNFLEEIGTSAIDKSSIPSPSRRPGIEDIEKIVATAQHNGVKFLN